MVFLPRQKCKWFVIPFLMGMVLFNHVETMLTYEGSYPIDVATFTMLQVVRFWALVFSYADGDPACPYEMEEHWKDKAVKELPSLLEIFSYTFFCCGASIGVFFEYSDFIRFIKMEGHYKTIPNPIFKSLQYLFAAILFAVINKVLDRSFNTPYYETQDFDAKPIWLKYVLIYAYGFQFRTFLYSAFMLQNGAIIASGFGYNGVDERTKQDKWDTVVSIFVYRAETSDSIIKALQAWNHQVHVWLKHYV